MERRWIKKEDPPADEVQLLSKALNKVDQTLASLLIQRDVDTFEKAKSFFRPTMEELHDPMIMKDMNKAVDRLQLAIEGQEKILVYGDYDVDGTTSVAMVYSYLKQNYENIAYYIPDRYTEGYGISYTGIDYAWKNDFSLIIALDCGIKAIEKVIYAKEKGVDFIICDHHQPGDELPDALAVLDPKRSDCNYPYKELSGCGVGFKLLCAWANRNEERINDLSPYLDLLAISICADIVPITGENRILVHHGLKVINESPRLGIRTMVELSGSKGKLSTKDLVFGIAPRINAAGRIETGKKAVQILVEEDELRAHEFGNYINNLNSDRKELDQKITDEAKRMIEGGEGLLKRKTTVLYDEDWHKGVIGIVASRLIESYYRPTIILTQSNGKATGSARSVKGFDIYKAIDKCSDLLDQFGGHKYAAGLTLPIENIEAFIEKFEEVVGKTIDDELLIPQINIDAELTFSQITDKFYRVLSQFAPFGPGNMKPVFVSNEVFLKGDVRVVGNNHLKMMVFQEDQNDRLISSIGFNLGGYLEQLDEGVPFSIVYTIEENEWNGTTTLQLNLKDIRLSS